MTRGEPKKFNRETRGHEFLKEAFEKEEMAVYKKTEKEKEGIPTYILKAPWASARSEKTDKKIIEEEEKKNNIVEKKEEELISITGRSNYSNASRGSSTARSDASDLSGRLSVISHLEEKKNYLLSQLKQLEALEIKVKAKKS